MNLLPSPFPFFNVEQQMLLLSILHCPSPSSSAAPYQPTQSRSSLFMGISTQRASLAGENSGADGYQNDRTVYSGGGSIDNNGKDFETDQIIVDTTNDLKKGVLSALDNNEKRQQRAIDKDHANIPGRVVPSLPDFIPFWCRQYYYDLHGRRHVHDIAAVTTSYAGVS